MLALGHDSGTCGADVGGPPDGGDAASFCIAEFGAAGEGFCGVGADAGSL